MTAPVPVLPDRDRHEIRNTRDGLPVFWAHALVRQAFMFILATAARRYNIGIVAYAMMPNHIHIIVRPQPDPDRPFDLVEFRKFVRSNMALFVNAHWDLKGSRFCPDSVGDSIKILDEESEIDQLLYVETNGVNAGFGRRPEEFDGAFSQRRWLTSPITVDRPSFWFQKRTWNASEELKLCVPTLQSSAMSAREFEKESTERLNQRLRVIHKARKKEGLGYRTLREVEAEMPDFEERRGSTADHSRAVMVGTNVAQKAREFHNLRAWRIWYARALQRLRDGETNVVFPPGTYKLAREAGVSVANSGQYTAKVRRRDQSSLELRYVSQVQADEIRLNQRE